MPDPLYVTLPLGTVAVRLERRGLGLGERGGFEARWASERRDALSAEAYREHAKAHLRSVYRQQEGRDAPKVTLNLASHQLLDDLIAWSKLNYPPPQSPQS